jgi:hypothetical protein
VAHRLSSCCRVAWTGPGSLADCSRIGSRRRLRTAHWSRRVCSSASCYQCCALRLWEDHSQSAVVRRAPVGGGHRRRPRVRARDARGRCRCQRSGKVGIEHRGRRVEPVGDTSRHYPRVVRARPAGTAFRSFWRMTGVARRFARRSGGWQAACFLARPPLRP